MYIKTGIKDMNGNEVKVGDKLLIKRKVRRGRKKEIVEVEYLVRWVDGAFWAQNTKYGVYDFITPILLCQLSEDYEIIKQ